MRQLSLDGTWQLAYGPEGRHNLQSPQDLRAADVEFIPCTVPGNVELDLLAAGRMQEPSFGNQVYSMREYETYQWWYKRTFTGAKLSDGQRAELVFEGLDCFGTIWLNDALLGTTDNMLIPHRFDVTDYLVAGGENELVVHIRSAVLEGRRHQPDALEFAYPVNYEALSVRKAPHMYGWDISPRIVSAGLWKSVRIDILEPTRWRSVYWVTLKTDAVERTASVRVDWDFVTDQLKIDECRVRITLERNGSVAHYSERAVMGTHGRETIDLKDVELWWPRGYDEPSLYDATLELVDVNDRVLDTQHVRLGIRTIRLERTDITTREQPGQFLFVVNGEIIFIKGSNWVPLDSFHSRDSEHLERTFDLVVDLNCNMLRCWGGNVYEDHAFFDLCDQYGVLVWQDFAMACAIYPQTDEFARKIQKEAEAVVTKLRNHPSLALWCGNNEVDETMGWASCVDPNTDRLSREVLPSVVRRLDPYRDYLPSSPYSSPELVKSGNLANMQPEQHLWGPRVDFKGAFYTKSIAPFVSEVGYHGCPERQSLEQFLDAEALWPWQENDQWLTHSVRPVRAMTNYNYRIPLMAKQIAVLFNTIPDSLDDFVLASQISQAEALKFFIERWRQSKWERTGILWWNVRDGWPSISDAVVDYYYRKKLAYLYVKRIQVDVCAMCSEAADSKHQVILVNDTRCPVSGDVTVHDADSSRLLLEKRFHVEANSKTFAGSILQAAQPALWLIRWETEQGTYLNHYLAGPRPFELEDYRRWLIALKIPAGWNQNRQAKE